MMASPRLEHGVRGGAAGDLYVFLHVRDHDVFERDTDFQEEVRNVARAVGKAVVELRAGRLSQPDRALRAPRLK